MYVESHNPAFSLPPKCPKCFDLVILVVLWEGAPSVAAATVVPNARVVVVPSAMAARFVAPAAAALALQALPPFLALLVLASPGAAAWRAPVLLAAPPEFCPVGFPRFPLYPVFVLNISLRH